MKTKRILATLALAGAMVLTACGGQKSSDNQSKTKTEETKKEYTPATVRVAYMPNLGSASSLFTAMDQGYFKEV